MASCMAMKRSFDHDRDSSTNPFESRNASPSSKRQRRLFPVTVVSSSSPPPASTMTTTSTSAEPAEPSSFPDIQPTLTADVLLARIKEEVRRLRRRHQLKSAAPSASPPSDASDEETSSSPDQRSLANSTHLLTLKQVNMICARLLKEREEKIREEYDRILAKKLNEQYEGFVRFTQDQLTRRFSELQFSYVS